MFGLTDTRQYFRHLQSYFLGFTGGVLADLPLADLLRQRPGGADQVGHHPAVRARPEQAVPQGELCLHHGIPGRRAWWRPARTR